MSKTTTLPNVRKMFIPDPGYTMFDCDLAGADAQVVAFEAEDLELIEAFRKGLDVHSKNAEDLFGRAFTQLAGDKDNGPKSKKRKECKQGVHATNYGGSARTLAKVLGWTVHEADTFQRRWFSLHPGIKRNFHGRVESSLRSTRSVTNRFGNRRVYFDRIDSCFTEALAWIPQSTVAEVSFRGAIQLEDRTGSVRNKRGAIIHCGWVEMLLQVHDSVVFQVLHEHENRLAEINTHLRYPIPYGFDTLTIGWGIARSRSSWGECESVKLAA
jgi:DNA polymerase I